MFLVALGGSDLGRRLQCGERPAESGSLGRACNDADDVTQRDPDEEEEDREGSARHEHVFGTSATFTTEQLTESEHGDSSAVERWQGNQVQHGKVRREERRNLQEADWSELFGCTSDSDRDPYGASECGTVLLGLERRRDELAEAVQALAGQHGGSFRQVVGDELLRKNFPAIHAVGRASSRAPRRSTNQAALAESYAAVRA